MYKNYENRVKEFIIDMNNPETKIEIKDYKERINNPKTEMSKEKELQKPFIFKGYTTELDRIKDSVKKNRYLYNLPDYDEILHKKSLKKKSKDISLDKNNNNKIYQKILPNKRRTIRGLSESEANKYEYILKNDLIMQPQMRFKPRTDLERVFDIINENKYGQAEKEKDVLDKQLRNIDLYKYKNTHELNDLIKIKIRAKINHNNSYDKINSNSVELDEGHNKNKVYFDPKKVDYKLKPWVKREDLNIDAHKLLTSYHYKTHFKAAKEVAANKTSPNEKENLENKNNNDINDKNITNLDNFNSTKINTNINKKKSCLLLPNLFKKKHKINKSVTECDNILENTIFDKKKKNNNLIDININKNDNNNYYHIETDIFDKEENDYFNEYQKNKNPFKRNIIYDQNKIKELNNIAFQQINDTEEKEIKEDNNNNKNNTLEELMILNHHNNNEKILEDNNILIGNEKLDKNIQFDIITNKILGKCNILKHKSKLNDTTHKKRDGKLMITNGLSIEEFEKKYGFN